jgi:hypothetical protein
MDIQSFLLGMGAILVIASAVGGIVALVKVSKLKKEVNDKEKGRLMEMQGVYRQFDEMRGGMDSRFDKFENKVSSPDFFNSPERIERIKELINKT